MLRCILRSTTTIINKNPNLSKNSIAVCYNSHKNITTTTSIANSKRHFWSFGGSNNSDNGNHKNKNDSGNNGSNVKKSKKEESSSCKVVEEEGTKAVKAEETISNSSSSSKLKSDDKDKNKNQPYRMGVMEDAPRYPNLLALPVTTRPLFPGIIYSFTLTDKKVIEAFEANQQSNNTISNGYIGAFLRKDGDLQSGMYSMSSSSTNNIEVPEVITDPECLYQVGTLAQIIRIQRNHVGDEASGDSSGIHPSTFQNMVSVDDVRSTSSSSSSVQMNHKSGEDGIITTMNGMGQEDVLTTPTASLLLLAHRRINLLAVDSIGPPLNVNVEHWDKLMYNANLSSASNVHDTIRALTNEIFSTVREIAQLNPIFREQLQVISNSTLRGGSQLLENNPFRVADFVASVCTGSSEELQSILEETCPEQRLHKSLSLLLKERQVMKLQAEISSKVEEKMTEAQRKYFLMEQLKSIKKELGMEYDDKEAIVQKFKKKILNLTMPEEVQEVYDAEIEKLTTLEKNSGEFNITRSYLDWITSIPWGIEEKDTFDIASAKVKLDADHYGLDDVKDIILQFIAIGKLKGTIQGKILCLVGPPGVGKTSIASSIADALNRKFYRFSVGGLGDVSEIKGHRRTYVGAMPGKLIQCLKSVQTMNPLILIDEIDKLGRDSHRGDPSSALLEVLDPNQNTSFVDHFLDVGVDLSKVLFIATANDMDRIPAPLLDRMEIVRLSGYDVPEKIEIAEKYLVPKSFIESGLVVEKIEENKDNIADADDIADAAEGTTSPPPSDKHVDTITENILQQIPESLSIDRTAIESLVRWYCREAGVRNLSKYIDRITRKLALQIVAETDATPLTDKTRRKSDTWCITDNNLADYVGKPIFTSDRMFENDNEPLPIGVIMGLAWTSMGGSALYIETKGLKKEGSGASTLKVTGQLGSVMNESTQIAYTIAKSRVATMFPDNTYLQNHDIHMHVPEGATPKDGPSAGITMISAMLSLALQKPIRNDLAMTGEVSLTEKVLPVGGIKEKTMAARRAGITCVIFPNGNRRDYDELPDYLKDGLDVHFAEDYDDVYKIAFDIDTSTTTTS